MFGSQRLHKLRKPHRPAFTMQLAPNSKYTLLTIDILNGKTVPLDKAQISWTEEKKSWLGNTSKAVLCIFCLFHRMLQYCKRSQSEMSHRQSATYFWLILLMLNVSVYTYSGTKAMTLMAHVLISAGST